MKNPTLTEPGVKYFLKETLKQCNRKKYELNSTIYNLALLLFFVSLFGGILYYKYNTKPTKKDTEIRNMQTQQWILSKVKENIDKKKKIIIDLPPIKHPFEVLHNNFYYV